MKDDWELSLDNYQEIRKTGKERFRIGANELPQDLLSFWQWYVSDIVSNASRGVLAEYIVALAAGCETTKPRMEWGNYDLVTPDGIKIEVKSSAYLQSWPQKKLSNILFDIRRTQGWEASTNEYSGESIRRADIYVFCVLNHQDKKTVNPLNLAQWDFYVLPTAVLDAKIPTQQKIVLSSLKSKFKLELAECEFHQLKATIQKIAKRKN